MEKKRLYITMKQNKELKAFMRMYGLGKYVLRSPKRLKRLQKATKNSFDLK
jgi:hypothetical protein